MAWPSIRKTFDLPPSQLGALLTSAMLGYLSSSFTSGALVARLGVGRLLLWSSGLMVVNSLAYALAPAWSAMVGAGVLAGLGAGAIDAGINAFAAARLSPRYVNWLHAAYGIGAMLGPLLMTAVITAGLGWRWGYGLIGALLAVMTVGFLFTVKRWDTGGPEADPARAPAGGPPLLATLRLPRVWLHVALFFLYTGLEASAGQWTYSLFTESRGIGPEMAGTSIALYWGALTAGRIVSGALVTRIAADRLLRIAAVGAVVATLIIWCDPGMGLGAASLAALGFALAPIYPTLIAETPRRLGALHAAAAIGFQVAAAYLGTAMIPGLVGLLATRAGLAVIAPCLFATAMVLLLLQEVVTRVARVTTT